MKEEKLFRIGEVAKMFHISMGTLRHYEQSGLVLPEKIDERTGYRYYSLKQLEELNTIRYLRLLDLPLPQIAEFLENRDTQIMEDKLLKQKEMVQKKQQELEQIEKKIDHRLENLRDALHSQLDCIEETTIPASRYVLLEDSMQLHSYLDLEYAIRKLQKDQKDTLAFLGKVGVGIIKDKMLEGKFDCYQVAFLLLDAEDKYVGEITNMPEQKCVMIRFRGGHSEAPVYYKKLLAYMKEKQYEIAGFSREITLIDDGLTNDREKFVTEIRIPIV